MSILSRHLKTLGSNSATYLLAQVLNRAAQFLLLPFLTNYLSSTEFGIYTLLLVVYQMSILVFSLGMGPALTRAIYDQNARTTFSNQVMTAVALCLVWASAVCLLLFGPLQNSFADLVGGIPFFPFLAITLFASVASLFFQFQLGIFQAQHRSRPYALLQMGHFVVQMGVSILLIMVLKLGLIGAVIGILSGSAFDFVVSLAFIWQNRSGRPSRKHARALLLFGLPLVPHTVVSYFVAATDRIMLAHWIDLKSVGIYAVGFQTAAVLGLIFNALNLAWVPTLYQFKKEHNNADAALYSRHAGRLIIVCGLGMMIICEPLLGLLGGNVANPQSLLVARIAIFGFVFNGLYFIAVPHLFYSKKTSLILMASFSSAGLNICLNLFLIPRIGLAGPAFATAFSFFWMWLFVTLQNYRRHNIATAWRHWLSVSLVALIVWLIMESLFVRLPWHSNSVQLIIRFIAGSLPAAALLFYPFFSQRKAARL